TARASATRRSSPSSVSWLPLRRIVQLSRSRSAPSTPSPTPASSAATSFEIERTSCNADSLGPTPSDGRRPRRLPVSFAADQPRRRCAVASGQLLANQLADRGAVGTAGDLRHHVCHHPAEVAHARRTHLGDHVVDDPLELLLGQRLGHELLEHCELRLLGQRLLLSPARAEGLRRLQPPLALALEHLQLLLVAQRALQLLLRRAQAGEDQPQRVASRTVASLHRRRQLALEANDQAHLDASPRAGRGGQSPSPAAGFRSSAWVRELSAPASAVPAMAGECPRTRPFSLMPEGPGTSRRGCASAGGRRSGRRPARRRSSAGTRPARLVWRSRRRSRASASPRAPTAVRCRERSRCAPPGRPAGGRRPSG